MVLGGKMGPHLGNIFLHNLILENIFSKTRRSISIKLYPNYLCMQITLDEGIQVCLDKGTDPHKKGK
jgi:hypothetical protein